MLSFHPPVDMRSLPRMPTCAQMYCMDANQQENGKH